MWIDRLIHLQLNSRTVARIVAAIVLIGVVVRFIWLLQDNRIEPHITETQRVGISLANGGGFADAFRPGSGPTAHVSPIMPWIIALVYRNFGVATLTSESILVAIAVVLVMLGFVLAFLVMKEVGSPLIARLAALAFVAILPIQFALEVSELRVWEGALASTWGLALLLWILKLDKRPELRVIEIAGLSIATAVLFLISPVQGLAAVAMFGLLLLRKRRIPQIVLGGAMLATALVAVHLPWALRNQRVMGEMIWTRSNLGMELATGNHPAAVNPADPHRVFIDRLHEINAHADEIGYRKFEAAGGEVPYYAQLKREAVDWMKANPSATANIWLRHLREFYFPPTWFWKVWGTGGQMMDERRMLIWIATAIALISLPFLIFRNSRYLYFACAVFIPVLPYIPVQPVMRYRFLIYTIIIFLAADGVMRLVRLLAERRRAQPRVEPSAA